MALALFQIDDLHVATAGVNPPVGITVASGGMESASTPEAEDYDAWR